MVNTLKTHYPQKDALGNYSLTGQKTHRVNKF
jgi:hypothetical protein